jgi:hypothetical protein
MAEHVLGTDEAAGSVPAGGSTRMWRSGNASPCRGEVPGPIPGIRSRALLGQLAEPPGPDPGRRGSSPREGTHGTHPTGVGGSLQSCYGGVRFPGGPPRRANRTGTGTGVVWNANRRVSAGLRVLRPPLWIVKQPGPLPPIRNRVGPQGLGVGTSAIRSRMRNPTGDGTRLEPGRAFAPCRFDSCRIRWPRPTWSMGPV